MVLKPLYHSLCYINMVI